MTNPNEQTPDTPGRLPGSDIIGSLLGTAGMLYDSYQNRKNSKWNTQQTISAQKAEAELAYQRSLDMWHMQNAYNSPQAQMQRFQQAGLNPHLIYGQGTPGQAMAPPQYQPANLQYRYEAPAYGAAVGSILPTLMSVGTWMQNMRLSEAELSQKQTATTKAQQMIDYLAVANPALIKQLENRLSIFPYQRDAQRFGSQIAYQKMIDLDADYRYKYGDDLWREAQHDAKAPSQAAIEGMKRLQFLQQISKSSIYGSEAKLKQAQASWSDFDVTNPQAIMQLVMQGIFGLAGQTLRLSNRPRVTSELEHRMSTGRVNIRRRIYQK